MESCDGGGDVADFFWLMQGCLDCDCLKFRIYVDLVWRYVIPN